MKNLLVVLLMCSTSFVYASGSIEAGAAKSTFCVACHGSKGISTNPIWPSLAGQHAPYFVKQLQDVKKGLRSAPLMAAMVATLTDQDIEDLAAFYASLPRPEGAVVKQYLSRGEALYRGGDFDKHITACIACHGPHATGNTQAGFPVLSGQQAMYTVKQLQAFKDKHRTNDLNAIMEDIAARMSQEDMDAVANYVVGLH